MFVCCKAVVIGLTQAENHLVGIKVTGVSAKPACAIPTALFVGGKAMSQPWVLNEAPSVGGALAGLVRRMGLTRA